MRQVEHHEHRPAPHHGRRVELVLAGLRDPLNVGQAFRTAVSLGVRHLHLCDGTPTPPAAKINRTARGAQHALPWSSGATLTTVADLRRAGVHVLAVEYATASRDLREVVDGLPPGAPVGLVLGNEAHGLSREAMAACEAVAHLPLYGRVSSLNVAAALALATWEVVR